MTRAKNPETALRRAVRLMAARRTGTSNDEVEEVHGFTLRQVARCVQHLLEDEVVVKRRLTGKVVRYFTNPVDGDEWLESATLARQVRIAHRTPPIGMTGLLGRDPEDRVAPWPADAPMHFPKHPDGSDAWVFTRCPAPAYDSLRTNTYADEVH